MCPETFSLEFHHSHLYHLYHYSYVFLATITIVNFYLDI